MEIFLNNETYRSQTIGGQTVQQLADEICGQATGTESQMVVSLICDGQPVEADRLSEVLTCPIDDFGRIELQTVSVREQISAAISQAMEVLQESGKIRETAADCLNEGRHEAAMTELRKLLEAVRQIQQTTVLACQLLGIHPDDLRADGRDFNAVLGEIRQSLTELKSSMENEDFVLVSDLLRYELDRPFEGWLTILHQLKDLSISK